MIKNNKGITLIALIVTIIVLIIIAGISIAALTSDNGVLRQTNSAKVTQIEATAREQMDLACSAVRLAIAEASAKDNSYKANENASLIQGVLKEMLEKDSQGIESTGWKTGTVDAANGKFTITYEGQDYKNACNDNNAVITYTITLAQKSIEVTDVGTGIKGPGGSDTSIDIGGNTGSGNGGSTPVTPPTPEKLATPTIAIADDTLTITAVANATSYEVYVNGTLKDTITETTFDLTALNLEAATYEITVKAKADGYTESDLSTAASYTVEAAVAASKLWDVAQIGQYVNYDPTNVSAENADKTTYTSVAGSTTQHGNGYGTQIFSAAAYKAKGLKWQILEKNADETITLISDLIYQDKVTNGVSNGTMGRTAFYLSNGIGYIYAEEELHRIGAIYGYGYGADTSKTILYYYGGPNDQDGTITAGTVEAQQGRKATLSLGSGGRALTVEDINRICGKTETYPANYSSSTVTKISNTAKYYPTLETPNTTTGQSAEQSTYSGSYYKTYYTYSISSTNDDSAIATTQNTILKPGVNYWLGSRCVDTYSNGTDFEVRDVSSGGSLNSINTCYCSNGSWYGINTSRTVRAVVHLQSEIQTSDATYNEGTGWNLK